MKTSAQNQNKGFTLIEMMVSVSIFVVVALIVSGVLVQLSIAYKKAQAMRLLMDNLNFALEKMSLELREGVELGIMQDSAGYPGVQFKRLGGEQFFCYKQASLDGRQTLVKCDSACALCDNPKDMLAEGLTLAQLNFRSFRTGQKAIVLMGLKGEARSGVNLTDFYIQTTVSQRTNDP